MIAKKKIKHSNRSKDMFFYQFLLIENSYLGGRVTNINYQIHVITFVQFLKLWILTQ